MGLKEENKTKGLHIEVDSVVPLMFGGVKHENEHCFGYGDEPECWSDIDPLSFSHVPRLQKVINELKWRESMGECALNNTEWFENLKLEMIEEVRTNSSIPFKSECINPLGKEQARCY